MTYQWCEKVGNSSTVLTLAQSIWLQLSSSKRLAMLGHVCQLHYHGGGAVTYQLENGKLANIIFRTAPYLKVGQAVTFCIVDGAAVDVKIAAAASAGGVERTGCTPASADVVVERTGRANSSTSSKPGGFGPSKRLQREIGRFHNATLEEQLDRIAQAEADLHRLLEDDLDGVDGDGLCRLVRRVAAWLHRPVARAAEVPNPSSVPQEIPREEVSHQLQSRIRRVLIRALQNIDLEDENTRKCLESALTFIQAVVGGVDLTAYPATPATRQWHQLRSLVNGLDALKIQQDDVEPPGANRQEGRTFAERGRVSEGSYQPNKKIKGLPTVFEGKKVIQLQCSSCPATISSSWFFRHPGHEQVSVLVPFKGHYACRKITGKMSPWIPASDFPGRIDRFDRLNFCIHKRERRYCKDCGSKYICKHQKRRHDCALCKKAPLHLQDG